MHHLFLSPHYDDAIYSCGGTIAKLAQAKQQVTVLTVCAGYPSSANISPYAQSLHDRWGFSDHSAANEMIEIRRQEDKNALNIVGADGLYFDIADCIYRHAEEPQSWFYQSDDDIFGRLNGAEDSLISVIARSIIDIADKFSPNPNNIRVYIPLTIGNHVDHQLVRYAAERAFGAETLTYYQDYPYSKDREQLKNYESSIDWASTINYLGEEDIYQKIQAVAAYRSQISTFWSDEQAMATEVRDFLRAWGNGELFWRYTPTL